MPQHFVHAHCHSEYSLLDGLMRIQDWVPRAASFGYDTLCLTDHGVMYGAIEFYETCKSHGIRPILGMEAYITDGSRLEKPEGDQKYPYHLILLAQNDTGYRNLMKLCSIGYLEGFYRKPRIDREALRHHQEGIIALSACLKGEVQWHLSQNNPAKAHQVATEYRDIFGPERFFIEVQRHGLPEQDKIIPLQRQLAADLGLTCMATNDAHYLEPKAANYQDVMMCIAMNRKVNDPDRLKMSSDQMYFKNPAEMDLTFTGLEEMLRNTHRLAQMVDLEIDLGRHHFPDFAVPSGMDARSFLSHLAHSGLERRRPNAGPAYHDRLEFELGVIDQMGFNTYFLIVQDFVNFAKDAGIEVGPGRGSAASSLVAFATGITDIDPLEFGLIFERFLNPERASMPDVDIDFAPERRHEVIEYVAQKYGHDRVCQIVTFNRMKARAAIRDAGRVLDIPLPDVDRLAKLVPWGPKVTLEEALSTVPELQAEKSASAEVRHLLETAQGIEGLARNAGIHPAGICIAAGPVNEHVPLQRMSNGEVVAQFDMVNVEKIGLVKMDFLGLKTLTYIRDAVDWVARRRGITIDIRAIPTDDPQTFSVLGHGNTLGLFQLEGSGMRQLLMDMKPDKLGDIVACIALYRPGPLNSGLHTKYVRRKHGEEQITYGHPLMEPILGETYGVLTYQEQIAQLFVDLAGMTLGTAVKVIKIISKKRSKDEINAYRVDFVQGAKKLHGIPEKVTDTLFDEILEFAGYGFNKAHSAAYGVLAYQTAYLKANYTPEFYTAYLTSELENHDKLALIVTEMREHGLPLRGPCINRSQASFSIDDTGDDPVIRFGLAGIKGVGRLAAERIAQLAAENPFRDLTDFTSRLDPKLVNRGMVEALLWSGALDCLPGNRAQKAAVLDAALDAARDRQEDAAKGQTNMFDVFAATSAATSALLGLPEIPELGEGELLAKERQLTGLYLTRHPLESSWPRLKGLIDHPIGTLSAEQEGSAIRLAGLVSGLQKKRSRNNQPYALFSLEDLSGSIDTVVFPAGFEKVQHALTDDAMVLCAGRLQIDERETAGGPESEESVGGDRPVRLKFLCDDLIPLQEALQSAQTPDLDRLLPKNSRNGRGPAKGNSHDGAPWPPPERVVSFQELPELDAPETVHLEIALNGNLAEFADYLQHFIQEHPGTHLVRLTIQHGDARLIAELGATRMDGSSATLQTFKQRWPDLVYSLS